MLFRSLERGCFVVSFFSVRSSGSFQRYEVMYIMPSFTFRIVVCCYVNICSSDDFRRFLSFTDVEVYIGRCRELVSGTNIQRKRGEAG